MTTNDYIRGVKQNRWPKRTGRLWQRNYYEHVVRNEQSLNRIREYVLTNPSRWELDCENFHRAGEDKFDRWLETFKKRSAQ